MIIVKIVFSSKWSKTQQAIKDIDWRNVKTSSISLKKLSQKIKPR